MLQRVTQFAAIFVIAITVACIPERETAKPRIEISSSNCMACVVAEKQVANFLAASSRIYSGAEPTNRKAFAAIAGLGVRTIVSVDGVRPNVELAGEHGMQYVHIPIGYEGVSEHAQWSLARLVRDRKEPIYIHCHHGKHRGPAAAAIACRLDGAFAKEQALEFLSRAGTAPSYSGLYRDVADFQAPKEDELLPELIPIADVPSLAARMAEISRIWDRLNECDKPSQEDLLLLQQAFRESARTVQVNPNSADSDQDEADPAELHQLLLKFEQTAQRLIESRTRFETTFQALKAQCVDCHQRFRDR